MTTWARRGTQTTGEKLSRARDRVPDRAPRCAMRSARSPKNDGCESSAVSFPRRSASDGRGTGTARPGTPTLARQSRPSRGDREDAFCNFCRKWYGQAGDRKAHLSACSASLALYTRSARERPVRSSVKLFILRSRRTAGAHEARTSALFDLTTLQVSESAQLSKSGCQSVVFRFERDQNSIFAPAHAGPVSRATKSTNF